MSQDNSRSPFPSELFADTWEASHQRMMRGCQAVPGGDPAKLQQALDKLHTGQVDFSELPGPTGRGKMISVPLQKLDKCDVCAKTTDLRLCSSCASVCFVAPLGTDLWEINGSVGNLLLKRMPKIGLETAQKWLR